MMNSNIHQKKKQHTIVVHVPESYEKSNRSYPVLFITDDKAHMMHTIGTVDYLSKIRFVTNLAGASWISLHK